MASEDDTVVSTGFAPTTKITVREHKADDSFLSVNGAQPLADVTNRTSLSRPVSIASRTSDGSRLEGKKGDETNSGVILIGLDPEDAATASRTSISRGSGTSETGGDRDTRGMDDVTDTRRNDDNEGHGIAAVENGALSHDKHETSSKRHSASSSNTDGTSRVPVMLVDSRRRSSSSSSSSSAPSTTANNHDDDNKHPSHGSTPTRAHRLSSSVDHPSHSNNTDPTTVNSDTASNRPQSATEFQKFRDHLHHNSLPATTVFPHDLATHPDHHSQQEPILHPNPHHPGTQTEIIRIERAYTPVALPTKTNVSGIVQYDVLIPRFSPAYPRILGEYGIGEEEWGRFIGRVNRYCTEAFDPFRWSNLLVNIIALLTFWMSEWIMPNLAKRVCCPRALMGC
jgi:hypothetical protein